MNAPSTATPSVPPTIRLIDRMPPATPAFVRSTAFIAAVLIGDMMKPIPMPMSTKPGGEEARSPSRRVRCDCQNSEIATSSRPPVMSGRGPTRSARRPGERRDDDDAERRRQEADAGLERRVALDRLHVDRDEEEHREHRERHDERDERRAEERLASGRSRSRPSARARAARRARRRRGRARRRRTARCSRRAPAPRARLDERERQRAEADRDRRDAGEVDLRQHGLVARLLRSRTA